jgi:hypothetical protein
MTQEEKRIKLAKADGEDNDSIVRGLIPDYFNDLNAVHELEQIVKRVWGKYVKILNSITDPACATAPERCEAIGKTLNLW